MPDRDSAAFCMLLLLLWPVSAFAQKGSIEGFVLGPQYERVSHTTVEIVKGKWGTSVVSNSEGHFEFRDLEPGVYILRPVKMKPVCLVSLHKVTIPIVKDEAVHADLELKLAADYESKCVEEHSRPGRGF